MGNFRRGYLFLLAGVEKGIETRDDLNFLQSKRDVMTDLWKFLAMSGSSDSNQLLSILWSRELAKGGAKLSGGDSLSAADTGCLCGPNL